MRLSRTVIAGSVVVLGLMVSMATARAEDTLGPSDEWRFIVVPYLWGSAIDGDVTVKGETAPIDLSFGDIVDDLDFAAQLHFEAGKGHWGLFVDTTYLDLGTDFETLVGTGHTDLTMTLVELAGYRRWGSDRRAIDLLFGTRYWSLDASIDPAAAILSTRNGSDSWADAMVGARYLGKPGEHWLIAFRVDIAAGGSEPSYNSSLLFNYVFTKLVSIEFGYRYLDEEYETGQGTSRSALDAALDGPMIGVGFRW
jgi:hypothetical protein